MKLRTVTFVLTSTLLAGGIASAHGTPAETGPEAAGICGVRRICPPFIQRETYQTERTVRARRTGRIYGEATEDLKVNGVQTARFHSWSTYTARQFGISLEVGRWKAECTWDGSKGYSQPATALAKAYLDGQLMSTERATRGPREYNFVDTCVDDLAYIAQWGGMTADDMSFFKDRVGQLAVPPAPTPGTDTFAGLVADGPSSPVVNAAWAAGITGTAGGFIAILSRTIGRSTNPWAIGVAVVGTAVLTGLAYYEANQITGATTMPPSDGVDAGNNIGTVCLQNECDTQDLDDAGTPSSEDEAPAGASPFPDSPPVTPEAPPATPTGPGGCPPEPKPKGNGSNLWCEQKK